MKKIFTNMRGIKLQLLFAALIFLFAGKAAISQPFSIVSTSSTPVDCRQANGVYDNGTITVTLTGGTPPYTITWQHLTLFYSGSIVTFNLVTTITGLQAGGHIITANHSLGDPDNPLVALRSVGQPLLLTVGITPDPAETCQSVDLQLNGNPAGGNGGNISLWVGSSLDDYNIQNPIFNNAVASDYPLNYKVTDSKGCSANQNISVKVSAQSIAEAGVASDVCGLIGSLNAIPTVGIGTWTKAAGPGNVIFSDINSPTSTATVDAYGSYTFTWTEVNSTCSSFDNVVITYFLSPIANHGGAYATCFGTPIILNGSIGGSASSAQWIGGAGVFTPDRNTLNATYTPHISEAGTVVALTLRTNDPPGICSYAEASTTLTVNSLPTASSTQINVSCFGGNNGSVTVTGASATAPYEYSLDGGAYQASGTFGTLTAGVYTVTVRDANLCTVIVPVTITQPAAALSGSITAQTNVLCFGNNTGSVTVLGTNGTAPYQYSLDGGAYQASGTFGTLTTGGYTVTVRDANLCTFNVPVTITQPATALSGSITSQTNVLCFGNNTGSVTVLGTNGTAPYQYKLGAGAYGASGTFGTLTAGVYTVTVRDANLCTFNVPVTITQPAAALSGSIASQTNVLCFGGNNGSVTVAGAGGTAPYQYNINGGAFGASGTFGTLTAGVYTVIVRDANLCTFNVLVTITQPAAALSGSITSQTNVSCFGGNNGSVTVAGAGGTAPYQYNINGGAFGASGTFGTLTAGVYTVVVRDANLCTFNVPVTITQPAASLSGSITSQTNVLCFGNNTGSVTVAGSSGTAPYQYNINGGAFGASGTFGTLTAGSYTVTVRDAGLCTFNVPVTITQPATALSGSITSQTNVLCFGSNTGSVTVLGANGTAPYQYKLGAGAYGASGTFGTLTAGVYTVTVRDANLCTFNVPVTITQPAAALSGSITSQTNVSCFGGNNGSATVAGAGGTAPYQYNINGGAFGASGTFGTLTAGVYTIIVRDANLCTFNVPVTITQPAASLSGSITSQTNVLCFGNNTGSVTVAGSSGTAPYQYNINGGAFGASGTFGTLTAGIYTVTVRDANLCTFNVTVTITQPATALSGSITGQTNVLCFGSNTGSVTVLGTNGTAPYQYNINGGAFGASGTFGTLTAGVYAVIVRDANLCTFNVPVTITQPAAALSGSITSQTNVLCFGGNTGSVTVAGAGGIAPYQYNINGGAFGASGTFGTLTAGVYTVIVRDANLCTFNVPVTITQPAAALSGSITSQTNVLCFGGNNGSVTVAGAGGTAPYQYSLDGGAYQASGTFATLIAGGYTVTVQDASLCTFNVPVTITQPAVALSGSITSQTNVLCFGGNTGSVTVAGSSGLAPYQYSLDGGAYQASGTFGTLTAGVYTVTVQDANLCTFNVPVTITQPAVALSGNITSQTDVLCFGGNTGSVTVAGAGGVGPYQYSLDGGSYQVSGTFGTLTAGSYTVTVRDINLCTIDVLVSINQPLLLTITDVLTTEISCNGYNDGVITITASGGTAPYQYSIYGSGGPLQASNIFNVGEGGYDIYIVDANLCEATWPIQIQFTNPAKINFSYLVSQITTCNGDNTGKIEISNVSGGSGIGFEYSILQPPVWGNNPIFDNLLGGAINPYYVRVKDSKGCIETANNGNPIIINQPSAIVIALGPVINVTGCWYNTNGSIRINSASGGTGIKRASLDQVTWFNIPYTFTGLGINNYTIYVKDANNCIVTQNVSITGPTPITLTVPPTIVPVSCNGLTDGEIHVIATGGAGGLTYSLDGGPYQVTGDFTTLTGGDHTLNVKDLNVCILTQIINIPEPAAIAFPSESSTDITCFGLIDGTISASATGGTGAFIYTLLPGGVVTSIDGNFTGLAAGTYSVSATDINGCNQVSSNFTIIEPAVFTFVSANSSTIDCNGDNSTITLVTSGGTLPIAYTVTDGGAYNQTTNDGIFPSVPAGTYNYSIIDAHSCNTFIGTVIIAEPTPIIISTPVITQMTAPGANDGKIRLSATGGTPGYNFTLNPGGIVLPGGSGVDVEFTLLSAGTYSVDVTDANGCTETVIDIKIGLLDLTLTPTQVTCFGLNNGQIILTINSGIAPYTITWTGPSGALPAFNDMTTITGLAPGLYTVQVVDNIGVTGTASITIIEPANFSATWLSTMDKLCFGDANGSVTFNIVGGTPPYTISWTESGVPKTSIGNIANDVAPGTYDFTITDAGTCGIVTITGITLADPVKLNISNIVWANPCFGVPSGSITVTATGGTGVLTYTITGPLNDNNITGIFNNLPLGNYTVSLTDANGCIASSDVPLAGTLTENPQIIISAVTSPFLTCSYDLGSIDITVTGGTPFGSPPDYTYSWNSLPVVTSEDLTGASKGTYTITVTDAVGCTEDLTEIIDGPLDIAITDTTITTAKCSELLESGNDVGSIKIEAVTGGTIPYTYSWNYPVGGTTGDFIDKLSGGEYIFTILDANNCIYSDTLWVPSDPNFYMDAYASKDTLLCGSSSLDLVAFHNGPASPPRVYTYDWYKVPDISGVSLDQNSTFRVNPTENSKYYLEIRNDGGCFSNDTVTVNVYPKIDISVPLYISAVQRNNDSKKDTIIAILSGTSYNLDVITANTDSPTTFSWEPAILFEPANSWNSSIYSDKDIYAQIPANRIVDLKENPAVNKLTEFILVDVKALSEVGCTDSLRLYVKFINQISFANVFSPNRDLINDRWNVPKDYLFPDLEIEIFNRWGALVWSAKGDEAAKGWDGRTNNGKELPIGTYYYVVKFNIKTTGAKWKPETGSVTIVR